MGGLERPADCKSAIRQIENLRYFSCGSVALVLLAALAFAALPARGAVTEAWVQRYNSPWNDYAQAVAVDGSGNVVVTGNSYNGASRDTSDYYTVKYAATDGALLWEQRYSGSANGYDEAQALALDGSGNVVVTGSSYNGTNSDYYTAKYAAADGRLLWEQRYTGTNTSHDIAQGVVVDGSDNVVVAGNSATIKYSADGTGVWTNHGGTALVVDSGGNVVVTGPFVTIKYLADGTGVWTNKGGTALAVDSSGRIAVTRSAYNGTNFDYYTAKYAAADGTLLWEQRYDGFVQAVVVDSSGNVIATGFFHNGTDFDYYTAKYAAADGALLWGQGYNGPGNGHDQARAVAVDGSGNIVVTGTSLNGAPTYDHAFYTAAYAAADGALLWEQRYSGPGNSVGSSRSLALGPNGMVAVTGASIIFNGIYDYATVVYREIFPPVITCPANAVAHAASSAGAVVHFTVTATDDSDVPPIVTCAPASGFVFPIGQTTVTCTATDGDGLSSTCSFTVTVRGARGVKQSVLSELIGLRATVTDRDDARTLDEAIAHLTQSLAAEFWEDETHLERKHGGKVFHEEMQAVRNLCDLIQSRKSLLPDAVLQGFVDQLFQADRLLASVAIDEAITAGVSGKKIEQAQKFLARGDAEAADGKCANGIEDYRNAWKRAARAKVSPPVRLANGRVRLEIAGEAGERFTIQCSANLKDWTTLGTRTANAEGLVTFEDADAGPHPTRFYRVVSE